MQILGLYYAAVHYTSIYMYDITPTN